jgi:hypothetical protein
MLLQAMDLGWPPTGHSFHAAFYADAFDAAKSRKPSLLQPSLELERDFHDQRSAFVIARTL